MIWKFRRRGAFLFLLPLAVPFLVWAARLHLNRSSSLPLGLYREIEGEISYGTYVSACLPGPLARFGRMRGYLPAGRGCSQGAAPVVKRVVALPGDRVWLREEGLEVRGVSIPKTSRLAVDRRGRPILRLPAGLYRVLPGEVWVAGTARESWDSRYYGPLPLGDLRPARPVWVEP
jgi:conjugative transfer signal peptidase TraF